MLFRSLLGGEAAQSEQGDSGSLQSADLQSSGLPGGLEHGAQVAHTHTNAQTHTQGTTQCAHTHTYIQTHPCTHIFSGTFCM